MMIFDADPVEISEKKAAGEIPDEIIVEPEIEHFPSMLSSLPPMDLANAQPASQGGAHLAGTGNERIFRVIGGGNPLAKASVTVWVRVPGSITRLSPILTDDDGIAVVTMPAGSVVSATSITPWGGFWSMLVRGDNGPEVLVDCPALPTGPDEWWLARMGVDRTDKDRGQGVKIGVVDTGVSPHPDLRVVPVGAAIGGTFYAGSQHALDVDRHGTHVAGIIGGLGANGCMGVAPGAEIHAIRVFASPSVGAKNTDIAAAIDHFANVTHVDIINLSLGSPSKSELVEDAITAAFEVGTVCVCAAGNEAGAVSYPAALQNAFAVSALGLAGWGPSGSLAASRVPTSLDHHGRDNFYLANFSCHGKELSCAAPGVGIISAVPKEPAGFVWTVSGER